MNKNYRKNNFRNKNNKNSGKKYPKSRKTGQVDPKRIKIYKVHEQEELLPFVMRRCPNMTNTLARKLISGSQVSVGGVPTTSFKFVLYPEDEVLVSYDRISKRPTPRLPIIYEDENMVVINKPAGLLSIASDKEKRRTAYRYVSDYVAAKNRNSRIFVVHRLDEQTSGVLVFAKNYETKKTLQKHWNKIVHKRGYYAIVEGEDIKDHANLRDYLAESNCNLMYVTKNRKFGKLCLTEYQKIGAKNGYSLLDVNIKSGRKNQIRVQLGNTGHFVIGDDKYGEPANPINRLGLHAYELVFDNPVTKQSFCFTAQLPKEMKNMFRGIEIPKSNKNAYTVEELNLKE